MATKQDLIDTVARDADITKTQALKFLDELTSLTIAEIQQGRRVVWPNFGTFNFYWWKPRMVRSIRTGHMIPVSGHNQITFKPSKIVQEAVN